MHLNLLESYSADLEIVFEMFLDENYHRSKIVEGRGEEVFIYWTIVPMKSPCGSRWNTRQM